MATRIVPTIKPDPQREGEYTYCTVSFLSPSKYDKTSMVDMRIIKVYSAHYNEKEACEYCKLIRGINDKHDVFPVEIGKLYAWDDPAKVDRYDYQNNKLNEMEEERIKKKDITKVMKEQYKNQESAMLSQRQLNLNKQRERLQKKLMEDGKVSKRELELRQAGISQIDAKKMSEQYEVMDHEIETDQTYQEDFLDVTSLDDMSAKFAILTYYSPTRILNLDKFCFKIRGVYDDPDTMKSVLADLQAKYVDDMLSYINVGIWSVYSSSIEPSKQISYSNYVMKQHIDFLDREKTEVKERIEKQKEKDNVRKAAAPSTQGVDLPPLTKPMLDEETPLILTKPEDSQTIKDILDLINKD